MQGVPLICAIKTAPRHCWMSLRQRAGVAQDSGWLDSSLEIIPLDYDSSVGFAVVVFRVSNVPQRLRCWNTGFSAAFAHHF